MGLPRFWVNTSTLNLVIEDTDFAYGGLGPDITLTRTYNLNPGQSGMFGNGWRFHYDSEIAVTCSGGWLKKGSGQQLFYTGETCPVTPSYPISTTPPAGNSDSLALVGADIWLLEDRETRWTYRYDFVKELETGTDPLSFKTLQLTSITDQNGNQVQIVLNADATINYLQDAAGRRTTFTYDAKRRCTRMVTPNGEQATYAYDARGNLVSSVDLLGNLTTYAYDAGNYMTSMTVGNKTTRFAYSGTGREKKLAAVTDALGHVTSYSAAAKGMDNMVSVRDPEGKITKFTSHDGKNTKIVDPLQYEALKGYAPTALNTYTTGLKTDITDRRGVPTSLEYDARNNLTATSIPQGIKRAFTYDLADNPVSKTVAHWGNAQTWQYAYDAKRNLTQITSPSLKQTVRTFDAKGQITSLRNANGKTFSFEHDAFGNPSKATDPLGNTIRLAYDPWGINVTAVTDALGNTSHLEYDANRRLTKVIHPDNAAMTFTYDCCALTAVTDENGHSTSIASNKLLSPVSITNPLGHSTALSYDSNNKLTAVQDPLGNSATISDDAGGRPVTLTNPLGGTLLRQYDGEWNMTAVTDERGNTTTLEYDSNHLPTAETDPLGNIVRRIRDDAGRFTGVINSRNAFVSFAYDADGKKTGKVYNGVSAATYDYDNNGNLTQFTGAGGTTSFLYNEVDQMTQITWPDSRIARFTYDQVGRTAVIAYPDGITASYTYDSRGRVATMGLGSGTLTFGYDPVGNLLSENRPNGTSTTYSYNQVNLPTEINHRKTLASFAEITYAYDALGNVTAETNSLLTAPDLQGKVITGAYNSANQIRSWGDQDFKHDPDGNLTAITGGTDMNAVYDQENRLVSLTRNGMTTTHSYDGLGRRAKSITGSQVTRYYYDAEGRLLFTTNASGTMTACYFYSGKRLVAMRDPSGGYFYYHFDKNGNTLVLTDSSGNKAASYAYTPFGEMLLRNSSVINPFTYVGAYGVMDDGGGLFYMKNRHYNSATGRFLQKDPLRFAAGTNVYAYGNNNPVKYIDPDGTLVKEMAAGAASSAAYWLLASNPVGWGAATAFGAGWAAYEVGNSLYSMIGRMNQGVGRADEYGRTFITRVDSYDNDAVAQRSQFGQDVHRDSHHTCVDGFEILQNAPLPVPTGPVGETIGNLTGEAFSPEYMDNASDTENVGEPADYGENEE